MKVTKIGKGNNLSYYRIAFNKDMRETIIDTYDCKVFNLSQFTKEYTKDLVIIPSYLVENKFYRLNYLKYIVKGSKYLFFRDMGKDTQCSTGIYESYVYTNYIILKEIKNEC